MELLRHQLHLPYYEERGTWNKGSGPGWRRVHLLQGKGYFLKGWRDWAGGRAGCCLIMAGVSTAAFVREQKRRFATAYVTFLCHSGIAPRLQHLILNVFRTVLVISWGCYDMPTLLVFMKDCCVLLKEEWDYMNRLVVSSTVSSSSREKKTKQTSQNTKKDRKWKIFFFIGEFWNVQTKQLFFQLLQVLNSKKILCCDLSQRIILSWSWWTAGFVASLAVVIPSFDLLPAQWLIKILN